MAKKKPVLGLQPVFSALDRKDRNFYRNLSDEEKKAFSPYLHLRYSSFVEESADIHGYCVYATNEYVNKNFWEIAGNKEFAWLLLTAANPKVKSMRRKWVAVGRKSTTNKKEKLLAKLYPNLAADDIKTLATINSDIDIRELARAHGYTDKDIKL